MATSPRRFGVSRFSRLAVAHATSVAGDTFVTIALAGSIFFTVPAAGAQLRVLGYLLLTAAPFAVVAPFVGPALDRSRGGRRLLVSLAGAGRAVLCLLMMDNVDGLLLFPLAFGLLVLAKSHSVAKSALVPAVVDDESELVAANSRLAVLSVVAATVAGLPAAGIMAVFGAEPTLFLGALVFVATAVLALRIPKAAHRAPAETVEERAELHVPSIVLAGTAMGVLRGGVGFLTFFAAFWLKEAGEPTWFFGLVIAASGAGNFLGNVVAPVLRRRLREEVLLAGSLLAPAVVALFGARSSDRASFVLVAFVLAMGAACGRLAFDSLLQRDGPDEIRGRTFARFETRFQLIWVAGAVVPVALFTVLTERVGFFLLALALGASALTYVGALRSGRLPEPRPRRDLRADLRRVAAVSRARLGRRPPPATLRRDAPPGPSGPPPTPAPVPSAPAPPAAPSDVGAGRGDERDERPFPGSA